jgi:hypothetical protein
MKKTAKRIIPLATLAILLISIAPAVNASTLTVNLNPTTGLAKINSVSTTKIVFTYPAGSSVSKYLENVSSTVDLNSTFAGTSGGARELQGSFDHQDKHISVQNMTVALDYVAKGSATELVIDKTTNVTAWATGAFAVVNGSVTADLGWRSFVVQGPLNLDMDDHNMDINQVGSAVQYSIASQAVAASFMLNAFGGRSIWGQSTLNFSALDTPLSTWTKNYDAATNTTTFTKTISGSSTFSSSLDINGQNYTLSATSDPTGVVAVQGYANAQGDSLVITAAPASTASYASIVVAVVAVAAAAGYLAFRLRKPKPAASVSTAVPA